MWTAEQHKELYWMKQNKKYITQGTRITNIYYHRLNQLWGDTTLFWHDMNCHLTNNKLNTTISRSTVKRPNTTNKDSPCKINGFTYSS